MHFLSIIFCFGLVPAGWQVTQNSDNKLQCPVLMAI